MKKYLLFRVIILEIFKMMGESPSDGCIIKLNELSLRKLVNKFYE